MGNPPYYQPSPPVASVVSQRERRIKLVAHNLSTYNLNKRIRDEITETGTAGIECELRDGSKTVGCLKGRTIGGLLSATLVFTKDTGRFVKKGTTLVVQGHPDLQDEGDWTVVGGTKDFDGAQGKIHYKSVHPKNKTTMDLNIHVTFPWPELQAQREAKSKELEAARQRIQALEAQRETDRQIIQAFATQQKHIQQWMAQAIKFMKTTGQQQGWSIPQQLIDPPPLPYSASPIPYGRARAVEPASGSRSGGSAAGTRRTSTMAAATVRAASQQASTTARQGRLQQAGKAH